MNVFTKKLLYPFILFNQNYNDLQILQGDAWGIIAAH